MNRFWLIILSVLASIIFKSVIASNASNQEMPTELTAEDLSTDSQKSSKVSSRPLMTFSPHLPIEISTENRQNLLEGSAQEQKAISYNQEILAQSQIPWIELLAAFLVGSFLLALRYGDTKAKIPEETAQQRMVRIRQESLNTLDALQQQNSLPQGHYSLFYETVSDTLRHYVDEKYLLHTSSLTSQEFLRRIENPPLFNEEMQKRLKQLFVNAELVKFAKQKPSLEECKKAEQTAREILKN